MTRLDAFKEACRRLGHESRELDIVFERMKVVASGMIETLKVELPRGSEEQHIQKLVTMLEKQKALWDENPAKEMLGALEILQRRQNRN